MSLYKQIDFEIRNNIDKQLNDVKRSLEAKIKANADSRTAQIKPEDPAIKQVSDQVLSGLKSKLNVVVQELQFPNEVHDTYKKFTDIEREYNDKSNGAPYELKNQFNQYMTDFKDYLYVALKKMKRGERSERARSQLLDMKKDVEYYLENKVFPDQSIKGQTQVLDNRDQNIQERTYEELFKNKQQILNLINKIRLLPHRIQREELKRSFPVIGENGDDNAVITKLKLEYPNEYFGLPSVVEIAQNVANSFTDDTDMPQTEDEIIKLISDELDKLLPVGKLKKAKLYDDVLANIIDPYTEQIADIFNNRTRELVLPPVGSGYKRKSRAKK